MTATDTSGYPPCIVQGCDRTSTSADGSTACSAHAQRMRDSGSYGSPRIARRGRPPADGWGDVLADWLEEVRKPRPQRSTWVRDTVQGPRYARIAQEQAGVYLVREEVLHQLLETAGWRMVSTEDNTTQETDRA